MVLMSVRSDIQLFIERLINLLVHIYKIRRLSRETSISMVAVYT